jgi:hypothetical protein
METILKNKMVNNNIESGIFLSKLATSLENLVIILPKGFSSKNYADNVKIKKIHIKIFIILLRLVFKTFLSITLKYK